MPYTVSREIYESYNRPGCNVSYVDSAEPEVRWEIAGFVNGRQIPELVVLRDNLQVIWPYSDAAF
jgi:hypothetical protein